MSSQILREARTDVRSALKRDAINPNDFEASKIENLLDVVTYYVFSGVLPLESLLTLVDETAAEFRLPDSVLPPLFLLCTQHLEKLKFNQEIEEVIQMNFRTFVIEQFQQSLVHYAESLNQGKITTRDLAIQIAQGIDDALTIIGSEMGVLEILQEEGLLKE